MQFLRDMLAGGMDPGEVADMVHEAVCEDDFWIFTDMSMVGLLADQHASIIENRNPTPRQRLR